MATVDQNASPEECTTVEAARLLGVSVRSVQLMVDRGELVAWKTSGGHRRIRRDSVDRWRSSRHSIGPYDPAVEQPLNAHAGTASPIVNAPAGSGLLHPPQRPCVLLIEDSSHFQKLVSLLIHQHFPSVDLHVADDGIAGLVQYGLLQPDVLLVDLLLPGIDGATLITSLRSQASFSKSRLAVLTSLDESERAPLAYALDGVPVVHKSRLVVELPALLQTWLETVESRPA